MCGAQLKNVQIIAAGPFPCPSCHAQLQAPAYYGHLHILGTILLSIFLLGALGFRGLRLVVAVLIAFFPILFLTVNLVKYLIPPRIEVYLPKDTTLRLRNGPRS